MTELQVTARLIIHDGKLEAFKQAADKCMTSVRQKDSGTLQLLTREDEMCRSGPMGARGSLQRHLCAIAAGTVCLLAGGCASVIYRAPSPGRGTATQAVEVLSEPAGAHVLVAGEVVGITPARVVLKRNGAHHVLRVMKEGYVPADVPLKRTISGAVAGNMAFALFAWNPLSGPNGLADNPWSRSQQVAFTFVFPAAGVAIDFLTGAAYKLPERVHVVLEPRRAVAR